MAEVAVKYQPRVIEFFDLRLDTEAAHHLRGTLTVAIAELEAHESMTALLDALSAAIDQSADGIESTDAGPVDDGGVAA